MPLNITVSNFRGIEHAALSCAPIALVAGLNATGKSSVAQAVAACLTGSGLFNRFELTKGAADQLVRRGSQEGKASVSSEGGTVTMAWPGCELSSTGADAPHGSTIAAGLVSIATLPVKERAAALEPYLHSEPTKDDLTLIMEPGVKFRQESIDALWDEIQKKGWDAAAAGYEAARRDAGRDWSKITGQNFGSDKAAKWRPDGWRDDLAEADLARLEAELPPARAALEKAIAGAAVDEAELSRLRELAGKVDGLVDALAAAEQKVETARTAVATSRTTRQGLAEPVAATGMPCPHCEKPILLVRKGPETRLQKFEPLSEKENKQRQLAVADADGELSRLDAEHGAAQTGQRGALQAVAEARRAAETLAGLGEKKGSDASVDQARETVAKLETDIRIVKQFTEAAALYRAWQGANLRLAILVPTGLREKKLGEVIEAFNDMVLAPLCETAGWKRVDITTELTVRLGERPYPLLSAGEKYRVRATLQIAMARHDGSTMVVLDGADILDTPGRNGLFGLLKETGIPALVCMTTVRGASVPDLTAAGLGATYVIENARVKPLSAEQEQAA
jgi:hypothetical protein